MKNGQITYTFATADTVPAPLRGKTFTGGRLDSQFLAGQETEVITFAETINGQMVCVRVAGKPEIEAAVAEIKAAIEQEKQAARARLEAAVPGLSQYEAAMAKYSAAMIAFDRAMDRGGYGDKEEAAMEAADAELQAIATQYPATAMWRKIIGFEKSSNIHHSIYGSQAKADVVSGMPIAQALEQMTKSLHAMSVD